MKKIFVVDWLLIPCFMLSAFSGIGLHFAGHGDVHEIWHNWAVLHVVASVLFLVPATYHVVMHRGWYKGLLRNGVGRKSKTTTMLSLIFAIVCVTGFVLLFAVNGANTPIGLWHYKIGIAVSLISITHIVKRFAILQKSLKIE